VPEPTTVSDRTHGASGARIAAQLRDAILAGHYSPGSRIRQEDLAEAYGASRLPARDALRMLEAEGLVTLVANTGAWVAKLNPAECEELYQVRERLEPFLLSLNVPLLQEDQIDELGLLATAMEHTDDVEQFLRLDREFHLASYAVAETTMLQEMTVRLWNRTQPYRRVYTRMFRAEGDHSVHYEHHLIVAALHRRDAEGAERLLAGHIRRTRLELARHPEVFDLV
jgi:DNA-binding GntR family transcriptional regulator